MNLFDNADRKNVNVLGEEELTKVVGGWGGHWRRHGGGKRHHSGGGGGGGGGNGHMRKRSNGGHSYNRRQNDQDRAEGRNIPLLDLSNVVLGD